MKRNAVRAIVITATLILLGFGIFWINRDLYQFSFDTRLKRDFVPEIDERQDHVILGPVALKSGSYVLSPKMTVTGSGSGIFLIDGDEEIFFEADLEDGMKDPSFSFEISGGGKQVRLGIRYDPRSSSIHIERIRITADHVLYRDSLLRHVVLSVLLILAGLWIVLRLCFPKILWKLLPVFSRPENEIALCLLVFLTAASCYPLLNTNTYVRGEDMFFHVTRIRGLADSLEAGYFPVRNQLYWLHNYGYGVGFYYPDVLLYFPAGMVLLGFELLTAYKVFLVICTFFSIASVWYAALRISGNRLAAAASAVFMAFAAYRLSNVYYRGAVGETQAAMFYPLIILGLYEIFYGNRKRWPIFAFGFLGLFCCHIISLTMAAVLTALFLLTQLRKLTQKPKIFLVLLKSVLLVIGFGAFFWMPMLEQSLTNPGLRINSVLNGNVGLNTTNYAFPVQNLIARFKTWNFAWQADCIYPGWSLLAVPLMGITQWKKRGKAEKTALFLLLFSLPVIWMCTRAFPWQWKIFLPFVTRIQFAYRLLLPAGVMLSLSGGIWFAGLVREQKPLLWLCLLTVFCFFSTAFPVLKESIQNRSVDKNMFVMQDNRVSGAEYLPAGLESDYPGKNADTVQLAEMDVPLTITAHKRQKLGFRFEYELPENSGTVHFSVPLIYYTGYRGTLSTEDGSVFPAAISWDDRGLVQLDNQGFTRGKVEVRYQKTAIQWIGEGLSLLSICAHVFIANRRQKRKTSDEQV